MFKIKIKKSNTADTRTCNVREVSKESLLEDTRSHIEDVKNGLTFFIAKLIRASIKHDHTKIEFIDDFYRDFKNNFKTTEWYEMHQKVERHHFKNKQLIQEDVDLVDILEQVVDGVMAGMARSGKYVAEPIDPDLLVKAYQNTAKKLLDVVEVEK